jgi:hypothetical protein
MSKKETAEENAKRQLAILLTSTPSLRARMFANPTRQVGRSLPSAKYWDYQVTGWFPPSRWWQLRQARRRLAQEVLMNVAQEVQRHEVAATVNTDAVFEEFFLPIVKTSQRSFASISVLSWGTFVVGVLLIAAGVSVAIWPPVGINATVVSSIFGGTGAVSALGAVYATVKQGIREVTVDVARLRMVLTAFATQLGQLRALAEAPPQQGITPPCSLQAVMEINGAITKAMGSAVSLIPLVTDRSPAEGATRARGTRPRTRTAAAATTGATANTNGDGPAAAPEG